MSNASLCAERDGITGLTMIGFGPESSTLKKLFSEAIGTVTIRRPLSETFNSLKRVYKKCSVKNWDGYDALPITPDAYWEAASFIKGLPSWLPKPDISGGPDGEIVLE